MRPSYHAVLAISVTLSTVADSKDAAATSWRKQGIDFNQYRADATSCAKAGYFRDVSQEKPAKRFLRGFYTADRGINDPSGIKSDTWQDSASIAQPDRQVRELQEIQVNSVENCLIALGYEKFSLEGAEMRELSRLKPGSDARHHYLFGLSQKARSR